MKKLGILLLDLLFGFLIFLTNGEQYICKEANAIIFDEGMAVFLQVEGDKATPLIGIELDKIRAIMQYFEKT